jgi:hypothetical protein
MRSKPVVFVKMLHIICVFPWKQLPKAFISVLIFNSLSTMLLIVLQWRWLKTSNIERKLLLRDLNMRTNWDASTWPQKIPMEILLFLVAIFVPAFVNGRGIKFVFTCCHVDMYFTNFWTYFWKHIYTIILDSVFSNITCNL